MEETSLDAVVFTMFTVNQSTLRFTNMEMDVLATGKTIFPNTKYMVVFHFHVGESEGTRGHAA